MPKGPKPMTVEVHLPELIHKDLLSEHPSNSNKQSRSTYAELRKSIRKNGFDETLTVVPREEMRVTGSLVAITALGRGVLRRWKSSPVLFVLTGMSYSSK